jgi:SAM-dependent methyltransferase
MHAPGSEVSRCRRCQLVFLRPMPSGDDLSDYYAGEYRELYDTEESVERRFNDDLAEANRRVSRLKPSIAPGARVLEIGSGSGAFLSAVKPYAGSVQGIELDARSRDWIRDTLGLPIARTLDDFPSSDGGFDVIAMFHVLEHLPDPSEFLAALADRLAPEGKIAIEVPNVDDVLVSTYAVPGFIDTYFTAAHLFYFAPSTLTAVIGKSGLRAEVQCVQRYDLSNHLRWLGTGKPGGQGYYGKILSPSTTEAYARDLIRSGKADTLWAVCEKTG